MKTPFRPGGRPSGGPADEQHLLRALARVERAPDVTGDVMHRLGYRLASARHATRRRRRRVVARCMFAALFGAAIFGALSIESQRPDLRTPAAETVADALGRDLLMHESQLRGSVRLIRGLVGPGLAAGSVAPAGGSLDSGGMAGSTDLTGDFVAGEVADAPAEPHHFGFGFADAASGSAERAGSPERHRAGMMPSAQPQWMGESTSGPTSRPYVPGPRLLPGGFSIPVTAPPVPDVIDRSGIGPVAFGRGSAREAC